MRTSTEDKIKACIKAAYEIIDERMVCDPELKRMLEQRILRWHNLLRTQKSIVTEDRDVHT